MCFMGSNSSPSATCHSILFGQGKLKRKLEVGRLPVCASKFMACIRTCSRDGGIPHQRTAYRRGLRVSIPCLKEKPLAEPPLRRSRHNQKKESLRRAMQPLAISKTMEEDGNIGASWINLFGRISSIGEGSLRAVTGRDG